MIDREIPSIGFGPIQTPKPLIAITGTSRGIGRAIEQGRPRDRYCTLGLNRPEGSRGLLDPKYLRGVVEAISENCVGFINNAYVYHDGRGTIELGEDQNPQLTLFREILTRWQSDPTKIIVNICSIASYYGHMPIAETNMVEFQRRYRSDKLALLTASEQATLDTKNVRCRVSAFSPGYVRTQPSDPQLDPRAKMTVEQTAQYVWWLIDQPPDLRIPHLSMFAVHPDGAQIRP